jgi:broad specificity phosphatase PhoE
MRSRQGDDMARLYLVRHGEAAAAWGQHDDPGLSPLGRKQAADAAYKLGALKPTRAITSPLLRCRETAAAFEMESGLAAVVEERVTEIPTPAGVEDRPAWLRQAMGGAWAALPGHADWRAALIAALLSLKEDTAVFTHFVAINVALGAATRSDAVTIFRPANCSITVFDTDGAHLRLVAQGDENAAVPVL